ncbi:MAG TPA: carbonic anhydrase family protein [Chthoniobacterales bacterium]|nr:carbonic anhydrase family protein [Chthoniobacterales bacterium]
MRVLPLLSLLLFAASAFAGDDQCPPRFSYCGYSGPAQWPNIQIPDKENQCGGTRQSPIDLPKLAPTPGPRIQVAYLDGRATIRNTGYDIEVTPVEANSKITINKVEYTLVKFHFHVPSEHHIEGAEKPAEMHVVHTRIDGGTTYYAVIGVILDKGPDHPALEPVFKSLPKTVCEKSGQVPIAFSKLLPQELGNYYTYAGSLTTPPCTQTVTWYVLGTPQTIREAGLMNLRALGNNARLIQVNKPPLPVTYVRPQ